MGVVEPIKEIVFDIPSGGVLRISPEAVAELESHKQSKLLDHEAGGILLGNLMEPSGNVVVESVTGPHKGDRRSKFTFWRARDSHQRRVDEAWKSSSGTSNYLGEWHSHPEDNPKPSGQDTKNWRRIVGKAKYEQDLLFFLIVGRKRMGGWVLRRKQKVPQLLTQR